MCISFDSTVFENKSEYGKKSLAMSVIYLGYRFYYWIKQHVWKHWINRIFFEWMIRRLIKCDTQTTQILSFSLLRRINDVKQVEERNESLLSDWVKLVVKDIKMITFEYMIEISVKFFFINYNLWFHSLLFTNI